MKSIWITALALASFAVALPSAFAELREGAVIYGEDGRTDVYDFPDEEWRERAENSTVALFSAFTLDYSDFEDIGILSASFGTAQNLCPSEPFTSQDAGAFCSGTLIAPDIVLTAGHCVTDEEDQCPYVRFVFDYLMEDEDTRRTITTDDIYSCRRIIEREQNGAIVQATRDWALIQLDRPVSGDREVAPVQTSNEAVESGLSLTMIGAPSGIPLKIEATGRVRNPRAEQRDYFVASTDSYGGNSGSAVYDSNSGEIVGILTSGETDFVRDDTNSCIVSNVCTENGCAGENVMYAFRFVEAFCEVATDEALCGTSPVCGDGFCAAGEECAEDCEEPVCGDGFCHGSEFEGCPQDCVLEVPEVWIDSGCNPASYGRFGECNENCGAPDPDCDIDANPTSRLSDIDDVLSCSQANGHAPLGGLAVFALFGVMLWRRRR